MFDIGAPEFLVLAIAALFIFGPDRLPDIARQAARGIRQVRSMANNARRELGRELGPEFEDLDIADLNPRNFVRKHVLSGIDEDDLRVDRDLDLRNDLRVSVDDDSKSSNGSSNGSVNGSDHVNGSDGANGAEPAKDTDHVNGVDRTDDSDQLNGTARLGADESDGSDARSVEDTADQPADTDATKDRRPVYDLEAT
ncbi:sec-independent translocase [Actinopolymorpha pittospori]|uniref:Sec-independent protein translocase protein TatB n=1 Tax=Actinopolymorpha pittospori TaxID=648752 RepID=A0A927N457_9ACTN|nr:sec-independent protein translocase protein TatB [Actinopolymorpha pittospori]